MYWIPAFEVLDRAGFQVHLVNPRATKQVSGRKSDVLDCQWIWQLMSYGLLRGAFRAPDAICPMCSFVRQRGQLTRRRLRPGLRPSCTDTRRATGARAQCRVGVPPCM